MCIRDRSTGNPNSSDMPTKSATLTLAVAFALTLTLSASSDANTEPDAATELGARVAQALENELESVKAELLHLKAEMALSMKQSRTSEPSLNPGTPHPTNRLAVAVPFHLSQVKNKLIPGMKRWNQLEFAPCTPPLAAGRNASLVFVYAGDSETDLVSPGVTLRKALEDLVADLHVSQCFPGGMHFIQADVPPEHDHYNDAPCIVFGDMLNKLRDSGMYDHVFQMETDVLPVRPNWLNALLDETEMNAGCKRFWQLGSMAHCQTVQGHLDDRHDWHINGNSIWCLKDPALWSYMDRVRAFFPPGDHSGVPGCGTSKFAETGVDHALYRFRQHPANFEYVRTVIHKFQYTQTVLNKCEDSYQIDKVKSEHPGTFLVHSKAPFLPRATIAVREAVAEIFNRWPNHNEQGRLSRMAEVNRWGKERLSVHLCETPEHIELVEASNPSPRCQELCDSHPEHFNHFHKVCHINEIKQAWMNWEPDKVYLWNTDLHAGPLSCNIPVLNEAGALVHGEIDFGNCVYSGKTQSVCKDRLKVLRYDNWRGFSLDPCPNFLRQEFFEAYKNDPEFERVDAFICSHPAANCELYMPFNRSLIVYPTTRLEFGRDDDVVDWRAPYMTIRNKARWSEWISNLQKIAADPMNVVAANSHFEVRYIKYHTGIDAEYLPSWCGDKAENSLVAPSRRQLLLGPYRDNLDYPRFSEVEAWKHPIMQSLVNSTKNWKDQYGMAPEFARMRQLYPHYELSDLQAHPCIVLIPYQVSVISFFEYYRLNIPMFVPSKKLLISWHLEHDQLWERTYGHPDRLVTSPDMPDPTSDEKADLEYWIALADYYHFDHVIQFDSWDDLLVKYHATDLAQVQQAMHLANRIQRAQLVQSWKRVMQKIKSHHRPARVMPKNFGDALQQIYDQPKLGPDLALTLPSFLDQKTKRLAKNCPTIPENKPRCMCDANGQMPHARHCIGAYRCIPSDVYYPPVGNNTIGLVKAVYVDRAQGSDQLRDHHRFRRAALETRAEEWDMKALVEQEPAMVQDVTVTHLNVHKPQSKRPHRRFRTRHYHWRRSGTGTGTSSGSGSGSGTATPTTAPTIAPTGVPTVAGEETLQTTATFSITTTTQLTTTEVTTLSTTVCTYLESSTTSVTWSCTTTLNRRSFSYSTAAVGTYPASQSSAVNTLLTTNAAATAAGIQSSAQTNLPGAGVTVSSTIGVSTVCTSGCSSSDSDVEDWVIGVSVAAGVVFIALVILGVVLFMKSRKSSSVAAAPATTTVEVKPVGG
eukprot:TRINITY_DN276_c0_g1_i8.p1 TRINITY_DN276_c0_g1~~TRINITY_DN276_c0_g1_i8.p1  ORF type:complete len:1262 (-),score=285.14 TRINITY_DN276_c0_g1_i8:299-4084(-)